MGAGLSPGCFNGNPVPCLMLWGKQQQTAPICARKGDLDKVLGSCCRPDQGTGHCGHLGSGRKALALVRSPPSPARCSVTFSTKAISNF